MFSFTSLVSIETFLLFSIPASLLSGFSFCSHHCFLLLWFFFPFPWHLESMAQPGLPVGGLPRLSCSLALVEYIHDGSAQWGGGWGTRNRAAAQVATRTCCASHFRTPQAPTPLPWKLPFCTSPLCEKTSHSWSLILGVLLCSSKVDWRFCLMTPPISWWLLDLHTLALNDHCQSNCKNAI